MKVKAALLLALLSGICTIAQTRIEAADGFRYITTTIDYPITGTYYFNGAEPTVELYAGGNGYYQLHEQPKRAVNWGIECDESGVPIFKKGFDNLAYTLWYQYTTATEFDDGTNLSWKSVGFTIHFNSQKMFIQGERCKTYSGKAQR